MKLNDEQRKLVEDNHNLIYFYARKHHIDLEEYYDVLAMALCYAAYHYDSSKGTFSTLAIRTMEMKMYNDYRSKNYDKRKISNDVVYYEENFLLDDVLPPAEKTEHIAIRNVNYSNVINKINNLLTPDERVIVNYLIQGYNRNKISKLINRSHESVRKRVIRIKTKITKAGILDELKHNLFY